MNRVLLLILVLLTVLLSTTFAHAQKLKGIGMVDYQYIITESKAGQQAMAESAAFEKSMNDQLAPKREELRAIQADFVAREVKLKEADKAKIAADFKLKSDNLDNTARAFAAQVQQKNTELLQKVTSDVKAIVAEIAREKKINMVVDVNSMIFSEDIPDLTEEVLIRYNLQYTRK